MIRSARLLPALAFAAGVGFDTQARAEAQIAVTIDVDARATGTPLERVWPFYGYDEPNYTTTPDGLELLRELAAANTAKVGIRTHFLFNTGDGTPGRKWGSTNIYTEDAAGSPVYDYTLIDSILDAQVNAGTFPFVEIGFMPQALSTHPDPYRNSGDYTLDGGCFYPPRDYEKWATLVSSWSTHVRERYPDAESSWHWELWNEPDLGYWKGTFEEYARLYDYTEAALHSVLPQASLGGPAVAGVGSRFLTQFLEHCATGTNAVTGQTGTRLDFVSFHAKGGVTVTNEHVRMNLGGQLRLHRYGFERVLRFPEFARTPIVISEADPDGCAACPSSEWPAYAYRSSPAYGAYVVAMMKRSLELAETMDANLRGVLTWAFTFPDTPYFEGYRALTTNGIHLPVLNAFKLLGSLSGDRIPATSSGAQPLSDILENSVRQQGDVDALATIDGERIQILVWNYHDDLVDAASASVALRVSLPPAFGDKAVVTQKRVDDAHGNAHAVWMSQGSPAAPSETQLAALRGGMQPVVLERARSLDVADGAVNLVFDLPRFGISLLTLERSNEDGGEAPPASNPDCSCGFPLPARQTFPALVALLFVIALRGRRQLRKNGHAE